VHLLVGLTGSGKTTYAHRVLVPAGIALLSVDELMFERHGRYGVDYPEDEFPELEALALAEVRRRTAALVARGRSVAVDSGLWRRDERDAWKSLVQAAGGRWVLRYFPVPREELLRRLHERNRRSDAHALRVTEQALDDFIARFEPPVDEGEVVELSTSC
jgi:predicted kinase